MAYYAETVLLDALADLNDAANKDLRAPAYGATRAFNDNKRNVIQNYDTFQKMEAEVDLRGTRIDYLNRSTDTVGSARASDFTGTPGTSVSDTLTFVTYTRQLAISDDAARNNTQKAAKQLAVGIKNARLDIGASIETAAVTKLEAFLNTVDVSSPMSTWSGASTYRNVVANEDQDRYYNIMETEMGMRDYNGGLQIINYGTLNELIGWQANQGTANSVNLTFQYGNKQFYTSNSLTNSSDHVGVSYVCEENSLALVDWIPAKNREGLSNHANFTFTSMPDPFGIFDTMALGIQQKVQNSSTWGGNSQDAVWVYEVSLDVAFYIPTITTQKLVNKYALSKT